MGNGDAEALPAVILGVFFGFEETLGEALQKSFLLKDRLVNAVLLDEAMERILRRIRDLQFSLAHLDGSAWLFGCWRAF
jgi:hypothetical protein